uniref:Uncharacterized protein n=1 Tax=Plectus sambesii TaxID=2011161 RepID=A0A914VQW8_9BILA
MYHPMLAVPFNTAEGTGCRCDQKCRAEENKPGGVCGDGFNCICNDYEGQHDPWNVTGCGCGMWCSGKGKGWTRGSCGYGHVCFCS